MDELKTLEFEYVCKAARKIIATVDEHKISFKELWREMDSHRRIFEMFEQNSASIRLRHFNE